MVKTFDDAISTIFLRDLLRIGLKNRYFSPVWHYAFSFYHTRTYQLGTRFMETTDTHLLNLQRPI